MNKKIKFTGIIFCIGLLGYFLITSFNTPKNSAMGIDYQEATATPTDEPISVETLDDIKKILKEIDQTDS